MRRKCVSLLLAFVMVLAMLPGTALAADGAEEQTSEEAEAMYDALAAQRREAILNSPTRIVKSDVYVPGETYTGTAYYMSSSTGDDGNTGLSPDSPWRTMGRLERESLRPGDAVFFKRGDMWRERISGQDGVTFSAYGEGEKPVFTCSPDNVGEEKWELYYQDGSGKKIWKYYTDNVYMPGGIVLNGGEAEARRVYGYAVGGMRYLTLELSYDPVYDPDNVAGAHMRIVGEQHPETCLDDMEFCTFMDLDSPDFPKEYPIRTVFSRGAEIYWRCDAGNPGTLYDSIEFCDPNWPVDVGPNCVYDNLALKYYSSFCFWGNETEDVNVTIQNCEVAYGRQNVNEFMSPEPTPDENGFIGEDDIHFINDGIYGVVQNAVIRDNYIHDTDGDAITFEAHPDAMPTLRHLTYTCTGNLTEYCGAGVQLIDGEGWYQFDRITIADNYLMDTGYVRDDPAIGTNLFCDISPLTLGAWGPVQADTIEVFDNLLSRSHGYMMSCGPETVIHSETNQVLFRNNVYIQNKELHFGPSTFQLDFWEADTPHLESFVQEALHSEGDRIYILPSLTEREDFVCTYPAVGGNLYISRDEARDVYYVSYCDETVTEAYIPAEVGGHPVTEVGYMAFACCNELTKISFPSTITAVAKGAFYHTYHVAEICYDGTFEQWRHGVQIHPVENDPLANDSLYHFTNGEPDTYHLAISQTPHGSVTAVPTSAKAGETVTLTATPEQGYELSALTVTDAGGEAVATSKQSAGTYTFTMPASAVTVRASFQAAEQSESGFSFDFEFDTSAMAEHVLTIKIIVYMNGIRLLDIPVELSLS